MPSLSKPFLGYESAPDFLISMFGLQHHTINGILGLFAMLTTFITSYIWDDAHAVYTLFSLMMFDWFLGTFLAIKATIVLHRRREHLKPKELEYYEKRKFSSERSLRIFVAIPIAFWLLSTSWHLSHSHIAFTFLPGIVYGGFAGTYVLSVFENLVEMGVFKKEILDAVKSKLDITKVLKKK